jgi:hypothetical protein
MKEKLKKFTVHVKADIFYEAKISAPSMQDALKLAESSSHDHLWALPGDILDSEKTITGIFEC